MCQDPEAQPAGEHLETILEHFSLWFILFSTAGHTKTPLSKTIVSTWVWLRLQKADLPLPKLLNVCFTSAASGCSYQEQDKMSEWICLTVLLVQLISHLQQAPCNFFVLVYSIRFSPLKLLEAHSHTLPINKTWTRTTRPAPGCVAQPGHIQLCNTLVLYKVLGHNCYLALGFQNLKWPESFITISWQRGTFMPWGAESQSRFGLDAAAPSLMGNGPWDAGEY